MHIKFIDKSNNKFESTKEIKNKLSIRNDHDHQTGTHHSVNNPSNILNTRLTTEPLNLAY